MNKKLSACIVLSLFLLSSIAVVSAEEIVEIDASSYNFFTDFIHTLQDLGLFMAAGQNRQCSTDADYTLTGVIGYVPKSSLLSGGGCSVALFDIYDKDWHFIVEKRSEDTAGIQVNSESTYVDYPAIIEVYCCPYEACDSDSDCDSYPASSYGDFCNTNYGSCYGEAPSYTTPKYKCVNEDWVSDGTASFGEDNFCDEGLNNYVDRVGGEHCRTSSYSSVNDGTWCGSVDECSTGETDCDGQTYYTCSGGDWVNEGLVDGKCGYAPDKSCEDLGTDMNTCYNRNDCIWTRFSNCKTVLDAGCTGMREQDCNQGANCDWTGVTCEVAEDPSTGGKQIGESCLADLECESIHCDDEGWFQISDVCQPTPWSKLKKVGLERNVISDLTNNDLLSIACLKNEECLPINENYTAKCIPISKLKDDGTLTVGVDSFFENAQETISNGILGGAIGGVLGGAACVGSVVGIVVAAPTVAGSVAFSAAAATACTAFVGGGAIYGTTVGLGISDKDEIVDLLEANDADSVGLCVSDQGGAFPFSQYTSWASIIPIVDDEDVNGLLNILIGLGAVLLVFRK